MCSNVAGPNVKFNSLLMKKLFLSSAFVGIIGVCLWATVKKGTAEIASNNAAKNYETYCSGCHGKNVSSFTKKEWQYGKAWNKVFDITKNGNKKLGMPAFDTTFTDKEIADLTSYLLQQIEQQGEETFSVNTQANNYASSLIKSEQLSFTIDTVASGLKSPWGMALLPNGSMLISDKSGKLYVKTTTDLVQIKNVPNVRNIGQGGLLDVVLHPNFSSNKWIYLSYSKPKGLKNTTAIYRAELTNNSLKNGKLIFEATPPVETFHHYGSRMAFGDDGCLYFSVGDRGKRDEHPQYLSNACGKIHRINDDGSIPPDNPFVDVTDALPSIYSYGHRNPQGLAFHPNNKQLYNHEHGPRGGDEINIITPKLNYGWPVISYGINYNGTTFTNLSEKEGMQQPLHYWVPSIAPCGLAFVSGSKYPNWQNNLLIGSLRYEYLARVVLDTNNNVVAEEELLKGIGRVRNVIMGHDGFIYFSVENPGVVYKIVPE